jgi:hypothetical protein
MEESDIIEKLNNTILRLNDELLELNEEFLELKEEKQWDVIDKLNDEFFELNDEFLELQKEKQSMEDYIKKSNYKHCLKYIYLSARYIKERYDYTIKDFEENQENSDFNSKEEINEMIGFTPKNFLEEINERNECDYCSWSDLDRNEIYWNNSPY